LNYIPKIKIRELASNWVAGILTKSSFLYIYSLHQSLSMANKHFKRWVLKMPLGFLFIAAGIAAIIYPVYKRPDEEWMVWGGASIASFIIGLLFLGSAYIHKVKSDLIKRGRPRYKIIEEEEEED
jgi:uncharacterized membrane protein HdeD (DUF308 family)